MESTGSSPMKKTKKWDLRTGSKEMLAWIAEAVVGGPSAWDDTADDEIDPIAVMGRLDTRADWIGVMTSQGKRGTKLPQSPDLARRYFISREQSPVSNFFEKKKPEWTREQQIDAYRDCVWDEWLQKGNMPDSAERWLRARAAEVIAGKTIDLVFRLPRGQPKEWWGFHQRRSSLRLPWPCRQGFNPDQGWADHEGGLLRHPGRVPPEDGR